LNGVPKNSGTDSVETVSNDSLFPVWTQLVGGGLSLVELVFSSGCYGSFI